MRKALLYIVFLLFISVISFSLFVVEKWEYFYGDSCIIEFVITLIVVVLSGLIIFYRFRPFLKKQALSIISILITNILCVIWSSISTNGIYNMFYYQLLHLLSFLLMLYACKKCTVITILSGVMIFCSPIAYRIDTIRWVSHDGETMGVGNFAMLISVSVLFIVSSVIILFKTCIRKKYL